jgi:hypothetical protein
MEKNEFWIHDKKKKEGEMTQTLYAHMNKRKKKINLLGFTRIF